MAASQQALFCGADDGPLTATMATAIEGDYILRIVGFSGGLYPHGSLTPKFFKGYEVDDISDWWVLFVIDHFQTGVRIPNAPVNWFTSIRIFGPAQGSAPAIDVTFYTVNSTVTYDTTYNTTSWKWPVGSFANMAQDAVYTVVMT
jgi:hypothetical protein